MPFKTFKTPILAFNGNDQFDIWGISSAASRVDVAVILLVSANAIRFSKLPILVTLFRTTQSIFGSELILQLDHAKDMNTIKSCIDLGFDIIMADFSSEQLDSNIRQTKEVVEIAHKAGVLVEGELGKIPSDLSKTKDNTTFFTNPYLVEQYVKETSIDLLAVSVGNAHGISKKKPKLEYDLIRDISQRVNVPIVLHGGDFHSNDDLSKSIDMGVGKINFGPELRESYLNAIKNGLNNNDTLNIDHRPILSEARNSIEQTVINRLSLIKKSNV